MQFKDIVGHEKEIKAIKKALLGGNIPHAFLFTGTEGIGKRQVAVAFAKALNCGGSSVAGADSCGLCEDCMMMDALTHPNLSCVYPTDKDGARADDGLIRIEAIREVQSFLRYRVLRGRKVAIIDSFDRAMPQAANAFLKTLEEPPPDSVIILVSAHYASILKTIVSRCLRVAFHPLKADELKALLEKGSMMGGVEAERLSMLVPGSVSEALKYADKEALDKKVGYIKRLSRLGGSDVAEALRIAEEVSRTDDIDDFLGFLNICLRDIVVSRHGRRPGAAQEITEGAEWASSTGHLISAYSLVEDARQGMRPPRYANKQLTLEALFLDIIRPGRN